MDTRVREDDVVGSAGGNFARSMIEAANCANLFT